MLVAVQCARTSRLWLLTTLVTVAVLVEVVALSGPNVCMVKQKYNITKRIKYRAPMSVRTYEWCFSMPPRCSRWNTEMRDLTRLETEERIAEVSVCCPGYKMKDVSCVPICPNGKTGPGCADDCEPNRWGPNCVHECKDCAKHGACSPVTGKCVCQEGWQGESCETIVTTTATTTLLEEQLTTSKATTKTTLPTSTVASTITIPRSPETETTARIPATTSTSPTRKTFPTSTSKVNLILLLTTKVQDVTTPSTLATGMESPRIPSRHQATSAPFLNQTMGSTTRNKTAGKDLNIIYNRTAKPVETPTSTYSTETLKKIQAIKTTTATLDLTTNVFAQSAIPETSTTEATPTTKIIRLTTTPKLESSRKQETTVKMFPTTLKFKPKEIWIRPAQKGESPITVETKTKINHDHSKLKNTTKVELLPNTTPKTIIVSIIPTSVSYASFKKIALSTASYMSQMNNSVIKLSTKAAEGFTKSMFVQTSAATPFMKPIRNGTSKSVVINTTTPFTNVSKPTSLTELPTTRRTTTAKSLFVNNTTNSMPRTTITATPAFNSSNSLMTTVSITNITSNSQRRYLVTENTKKANTTTTVTSILFTTEPSIKVASTVKIVEVPIRNTKINNSASAVESRNEHLNKSTVNKTKPNATNVIDPTNTVTTNKPAEDEEKFHILTEPEHITAVMSEKETERSSVDLVSVISIAGGVMMAVITVAVIIVMMERCRRPRYDDVRKISDIRMQVTIDSNDVPPPYVRSIFHTPLPDPPTSEKCHYQPISTLDRNLKQFMRPVVVQTISPIMLENFRGILECHYDHLPRRSHDFATLQPHSTVAPSMSIKEQQLLQRASLTESAIEALKCEAKLDVIDNTTSEPLYAEIPCWRPPSEHAIEIMNVNGEAVTEL